MARLSETRPARRPARCGSDRHRADRPPDVDVLATVDRWQRAGGTWQLIISSRTSAVIALCTCTGGEEVDRISIDDPATLARLADLTDPVVPDEI